MYDYNVMNLIDISHSCIFFSALLVDSYAKSCHAEQKEQLKLIYRKFKEEVNQHMQECRGTVEGMEAQDIEFRGLMEKQSMTTSSSLEMLLFSVFVVSVVILVVMPTHDKHK